MRPILLQGHERSLTKIKYNREGDLLFSVAKDHFPSVWYSHNGERLGSYKGHVGAVWTCDVDWQTKNLLTGSADNTAKLWDVETGVCTKTYATRTAVRSCGFSYSGKSIFYTTDERMTYPCELVIQDIAESDPRLVIPVGVGEKNKVTAAVWGPLDRTIITGHENGTVSIWDASSGKRLSYERVHEGQINDIQLYADSSMFITASKDNYAKLLDTESLEVMKTYKTERPVNSAAISPIKNHVVLGGGQEARDVTTTSARVGKFDARFFHLVFEEEIGRVKGHFGPINTCAFHPDGKSYSSGGEDGYIRVHYFDEDYFDFDYEI
eukprot:Opistho-2@58845